jgi:hypothetical protein
MKKNTFNQAKYIIDYKKKFKARFSTDINKSEMEELERLLKEKGLSKAQFIRNAIEGLKKK